VIRRLADCSNWLKARVGPKTRTEARGFPDALPRGYREQFAHREPQSIAMQTPLRLTLRHLDASPALEGRVREFVAKLEKFSHRIIGCQVVVEAPPGHSGKGGIFVVKVELTVPGGTINVNSEHALNPKHADVYVALHDAFDSAKRQLNDYARPH
jgi:ribosomal subunit interface protein